MNLTPYLADLEARLDDDIEAQNQAAWIRYWEQPSGEVFIPPDRPKAPTRVEWPCVLMNDALDDEDAMVLRDLKCVSDELEAGSGMRLNVRCNYGTGILPSLFGCRIHRMERELDTPPCAVSLGSADAVQASLDNGQPDLNAGFGRQVFTCLERFQQALHPYPRLSRWVEIFHPDLQGPVDVLHVIWGSDMFYGVLDRPELFDAALERITDTYIAFLRSWFDRVGQPGAYTTHWWMTMRGVPMLRSDSLMNLSPQIYEEHIRPMDQRIYDAFGGNGGMHFCGRGDHFIAAMSAMRGLTCIAMSQPHLNDMETIYRHTVDKGIRLIGLNVHEVARAVQAGRPLHGLVHTPHRF